MDTVDLELNTNYKPFNFKYYLVARINEEIFCKEIELLMKIRVLTPVQQSQYGKPIFNKHKTKGTVRSTTEYRRLNHTLVRNLNPLPIIGKAIQKLEGFQYASSCLLWVMDENF